MTKEEEEEEEGKEEVLAGLRTLHTPTHTHTHTREEARFTVSLR